MRRRDFTMGLLSAAATSAASAQQPVQQRRIAIVEANSVGIINDPASRYWQAFWEELRRLGDVEGQNLTVERYSGEGRPEGYAELAREVAGRNPDVIVAITNPITQAIRTAHGAIPIVLFGGDVIEAELATSLAHPGGNITGVDVYAGPEIWGSSSRSSRKPSRRHPGSRSLHCGVGEAQEAAANGKCSRMQANACRSR
jgi:putative tryptophan/tyrosine transport system substrate-binding protein